MALLSLVTAPWTVFRTDQCLLGWVAIPCAVAYLWNLGRDVPSQTNRGDPPTLDCRRASSRKLLGDVLPENMMLREVFSTPTSKAGPQQQLALGGRVWIGMRTLEGAGVNGEDISSPSQVQTFPLEEGKILPAIPGCIHLLICVCEVCICITFTTHLHCFLLSFCRTQSQDCLSGNTIRATHVISVCFTQLFLFYY